MILLLSCIKINLLNHSLLSAYMHTMDWTDCKGFTSMSDEKVGHTQDEQESACFKKGTNIIEHHI